MDFTLKIEYTNYLDINYNPFYLNRYTDSLSAINSINYNYNQICDKLYFNFFDIYNNDLHPSVYTYISNNLLLNNQKTYLLFKKLSCLKNEILFNNKIIYIQNINSFLEKKLKLEQLEQFIINQFTDKCYLIINTDLSTLIDYNYIDIGNNFHIKNLNNQNKKLVIL